MTNERIKAIYSVPLKNSSGLSRLEFYKQRLEEYKKLRLISPHKERIDMIIEAYNEEIKRYKI